MKKLLYKGLATLFFVTAVAQPLCGIENTEAILDAYVNAYAEQGWFSGSVLVAKDGKILLCKGYGMANYEHDIPNTAQTIFRIGSITKQFTAMAIMQLQEKGLLNVNDPVSKYIPNYPNGDRITIQHLLTHTAGIPDIRDFPEYQDEKTKPHTTEQMVEMFKNRPLMFQIGEKCSYSNSGYVLLSYIIEKASGKKYETVLKENIFDPLGMENTGYDHNEVVLKNRASGYSAIDDKLVNAEYIDMSFPSGAGGLQTTVKDLYLWDQALYSKKLLSKKSLAKIFTAHAIINQKKPDSWSYGYGWVIGKLYNHNAIEAAGRIEGFTTKICRYPDDKICIIVLSNSECCSETRISHDLAAIIFEEKYELPQKRIAIKVNPEIYDQYVGKYKAGKDLIITIKKENSKLFAQEKLELYPESETKFFHKYMNVQISFVKDKKGKITKLILHEGGEDQVAEKIE